MRAVVSRGTMATTMRTGRMENISPSFPVRGVINPPVPKALAAMVMLVLHDQGRFSFDDPVIKNWPEFGKNGKATITIAHIMSHRAGIPDGPQIQPRFWNDRKVVAEAVEKMRPIWPPGSTTAYHSLSYGWVLEELVYRWEGRNIANLLRSELTEPLAIKNLFLGLPGEQFPRMAKMVVDERVRENQAKRALFSDFLNTRIGISLPLAAANGVGTARSVAELKNTARPILKKGVTQT
ncbi:MAG: serine hydrolase domain-containing protein [Pseudomonadota bacterium]